MLYLSLKIVLLILPENLPIDRATGMVCIFMHSFRKSHKNGSLVDFIISNKPALFSIQIYSLFERFFVHFDFIFLKALN